MKYLKSALLFSMLCLVPLGSWYYLKKGLDYRKDAMIKLNGTQSIYDLCKDIDVKKGETTLLAQVNNVQNYIEDLSKLMSEFDDVPNFTCLVLRDSMLAGVNDSGFSNQFRFQTSREACSITYPELSLIDTSGIVRRTYNADQNGYIEVIEHLAIILPSPEERDIKMKTYDTK